MLRRAFGRKKAHGQMLPRKSPSMGIRAEFCFEERAEILRYPLLIPPGRKVQLAQKYRSVVDASFHGFQLKGGFCLLDLSFSLFVCTSSLTRQPRISNTKELVGQQPELWLKVCPIDAVLFTPCFQLVPSFRMGCYLAL